MRYSVIDTNIPPIYAKSINEFNEYVKKYENTPFLNEIILTKSNNISQQTLRHMPAARTFKRANHYEYHYIDGHQHIRVLYAIHYDEQYDPLLTPVRSWAALNYFKGLMDLIPKDMADDIAMMFTCPENEDSSYYNYCNDRYTDRIIHHCYSIDRNSSFLASLVNVFPQAKPWADKFQMDKLYIKSIPKDQRTREQQELLQYDKIFVGWLKNDKFHRSNAWKTVIDDANKCIHNLRMQVEEAGCTVVVVNTDAVKFMDPEHKFHYNDSTELGGFKWEWTDTDMYINSVKSYAYMKDGKWKFKQAGKCKLDDLIPNRDDWTLEDFKNKGLVKVCKIRINEDNRIEEYYE